MRLSSFSAFWNEAGKSIELAVERIELSRQEPFGRRDEIEELRVAFEIEIGPAGVVGGDRRQGEG